MKKALILWLSVCSVSASASVQAGVQVGQIIQLEVRARDGLHFFFMSGTATDRPACAVNPYWMIKDENSVIGKAQLSMLLSAYMAGKSVTVVGSGACTRWSDGEDVDTVILTQ